MPIAIIALVIVVIVGAVALSFTRPSEEAAQLDSEPSSVEVASEETADVVPTPPEQQGPETSYQDGTYDAAVTYLVPGNFEEPMRVSLTIEKDAITAASVEFDGKIGTSRLHQAKFSAAYEAEVVGQMIDDLDLAQVGGASLSTEAFNLAVADIQSKAAN